MTKNIEKSKQKFLDYFDENNTNGEYSIVRPYVSTREKVGIEHSCGNIIERTPSNIYKYGFTCRHCYKDTSRRKSPESYRKQFMEIMGSDYELLSEYKTNKEDITVRHISCGTVYSTRADLPITMGTKCPNCFSNTPWVKKAFYKLIEDYNGEYVVLGTYKRSKMPIEIEHTKCGSISKVSPYDFSTRGGYCIHCGMSSGETMVNRILTEANVNYKYQYPRIVNPKNGIRGLMFDFSLVDENENVLAIIEYDGKQHSNPNSIFYSNEEEYRDSVYRDTVKTNYCLENNIPLLRLDNTNWEDTRKLVLDFIGQPLARPNVSGRKKEIDARVKHM